MSEHEKGNMRFEFNNLKQWINTCSSYDTKNQFVFNQILVYYGGQENNLPEHFLLIV